MFIMTPPWTLRAWPPVLWQANASGKLQLFHLGTRVLSPGNSANPFTGQTVWSGSSSDGEAGVAWDWVQVMPGIVAMADPMSVVTNLRLLGQEGEVLTAWEAARHLNQIVHALPWQDEVQRALSFHDEQPARAPMNRAIATSYRAAAH
jgi:hypothetical protein